MARRAFWTGYLKLSLVTCPVALSPATSEAEKLRFHTLNRKTGNRVARDYIDAVTGKPVKDEDEARGYAIGPDEYVILEDDELDAVALESTRTIDIEMFTPRAGIDWVWLDKPHYLVPDDKIGEEAFAVIRDAMQATGTAGIARLVLYRRERAVMIEPRDRGMVLWTLRYGDEVRDAAPYFADAAGEKPDKKVAGLMKELIAERTKPWAKTMVDDPVQDKLVEIIEARRKGKKKAPAKAVAAPERTGNVINIMDALKKSLEREGKAR